MSIRNILKGGILVAVLVALGSTTARADTYAVMFDLNTSAIVGQGTYALAFQLVDGSGTGDADNTVLLSDFNFGGGSASGSLLVFGGATGNVATGLTLTNSDPFFNAAIQGFVPGSSLTFDATFTNNLDTPFPDVFLASIVDPQGNGIPTLDTVNDSFITVTLNGTTTTVNGVTVPPTSLFAADPTQTSYDASAPFNSQLPAPIVTPEPSSLVLLASACLLLASLSKFRSQLKVRSGC
jgi:hypothetical protein